MATSLHFPLPNIFTFRSLSHFPSLPSEMVIMVALKFAMSSHFHCQKTSSSFNESLFRISQMARAALWVIENWGQMIKSCPVLHCSSHRKTESNSYQKLLEIEKEIVREVALGVINLTWENLQIAKHKSGRRSFSLADWFVLCRAFAICRFSHVRFITPSHLTHNLFFYFQ